MQNRRPKRARKRRRPPLIDRSVRAEKDNRSAGPDRRCIPDASRQGRRPTPDAAACAGGGPAARAASRRCTPSQDGPGPSRNKNERNLASAASRLRRGLVEACVLRRRNTQSNCEFATDSDALTLAPPVFIIAMR